MNPWNHTATAAMEVLIQRGEPFTADDLAALVNPPDPGHQPNGRNSAIGSLFAQYSSQKRIVPVGVSKSTAKHRKGGLVRIWQGVPA